MSEIKEKIIDSINKKALIGVKFLYAKEAMFYYALKQNETFFFGVEEYDFTLDSYQIRRKEDINDAAIIDNYSSLINIKEGLIEQIKDYKIDISSFQTIFQYLQYLDKIIIIEREINDDDNFFVIGKIEEVIEDAVLFKDFNIDGEWNEEIDIIPFDLITTIRFNSKYINVWSKYIKE